MSRLAVCVGIGELDVRASSVRDGVLRLVPASVGPRSKSSARIGAAGCPRHSTSMPPSTRASRSTTSPRWTTGAGRSCDRSHWRASVARSERIGPPTGRSQRSTRGSSRTTHGGLGSATWSCIASSRSPPRSTTSTRCSPKTISGCRSPTRIIRVRSWARRDGRPIRYLCRLDQLDRGPRRRVVGGRSPLGMGTMGHRRRPARRAADGADALGARDRIPPDPVAGTIHNELLISADAEAAVASPPADVDELDRRDMSGARRTNLRRSPMTPEERILGAAFDRPDEIAHREEAHEVRRTWVRRGPRRDPPRGRAARARGAGDDRPGRGRRPRSVARRLCGVARSSRPAS